MLGIIRPKVSQNDYIWKSSKGLRQIGICTINLGLLFCNGPVHPPYLLGGSIILAMHYNTEVRGNRNRAISHVRLAFVLKQFILALFWSPQFASWSSEVKSCPHFFFFFAQPNETARSFWDPKTLNI